MGEDWMSGKKLLAGMLAGVFAVSAFAADNDLDVLRGLVLNHAKVPLYNKKTLQLMAFCDKAERQGKLVVGSNTLLDLIRRDADVDAIKDKAAEATSIMAEKAGELKDAAVDVKDDIAAKLTELDRMLQESVTEYNDAYTIMNDKGVQLYIERCRSLDSISFVESLVNSIANRPKSFDTEFEEISVHRKKFTESRDFADRELQEARKAAAGAGAGLEPLPPPAARPRPHVCVHQPRSFGYQAHLRPYRHHVSGPRGRALSGASRV